MNFPTARDDKYRTAGALLFRYEANYFNLKTAQPQRFDKPQCGGKIGFYCIKLRAALSALLACWSKR
jgi:hypothetical protein